MSRKNSLTMSAAVVGAVLTTDELERRLAKQLKRTLNDEQNELLDQVRRHNKVKNLANLTGDIHAARARYRAASVA